MREVRYLGVEDLLLFTRALGAGPVRDVGLLESAAARPQATVFGDDAYPTLELKAAALMESLCRNHALVDDNKRLTLLGTFAFLRMNEHPAKWHQDYAFDLVMRVAEGKADVTEIAAALSLDG